MVLEDLGSANGTSVNNHPLAAPRTLHDGDVLTLGSVSIRYEWPSSATRFDVGHQQAAHINNVGRDQYIDQRQESFLRQIAAARTRARRIILFGFVIFLCGFAVFAYGLLRLMGSIGDPVSDNPNEWSDPGEMFGAEIGGFPVFLLGWAAAGVGTVLMITGFVMHVVAASRQRSFDAAVGRR
jgi:hypothetical protein